MSATASTSPVAAREAVPITIQIRKWTPAQSGARAGFVDVAVVDWGVILHDVTVFKKAENGTTRTWIALPCKKVGEKWLPAVEWIDRRSSIAQALSRATIEALKDYIRTNGGAA
jgi:hypothetical protein